MAKATKKIKKKKSSDLFFPEQTARKYVYAYDPEIDRRCIHVVKVDQKNKLWAISLVTGHKFRYKK